MCSEKMDETTCSSSEDDDDNEDEDLAVDSAEVSCVPFGKLYIYNIKIAYHTATLMYRYRRCIGNYTVVQ